MLAAAAVPNPSDDVRVLDISDAFVIHNPPMVLGEGVLYRPLDNTLHYLDIERSPVTALYIAQLDEHGNISGQPKEIEIKGSRYVTALAFRKDHPGSYFCTTHTGLAYLDESTGQLEDLPGFGFIIAEADKDAFRFNDAVCDSCGRWYFHSMSKDQDKKAGKLYMYEHGMQSITDLKILEEGFAIGNGPVVDEERGKFYFNFTDSDQSIGWVYDYDAATGSVSNRQVFFDNSKRRPATLLDPASALLGPGFPDGHTLDSQGRVYQAGFGRGCIERFTPEGKHDLTIRTSARCPTCPVFGGPKLNVLYITTASEALFTGERLLGDKGGSVYRVDLSHELGEGTKGLVKPPFAG